MSDFWFGYVIGVWLALVFLVAYGHARSTRQRRRGVLRFYDQARHDGVRLASDRSWCHCRSCTRKREAKRIGQHDTWGKVYPECQCEGCRNERCYVESRNMWTAAIMRGTHDPFASSEELDARYTASKPHVCTVDKACAHIRTAPGRMAFTPLFSPPADWPAPTSGPCDGCRMDTMRLSNRVASGWQCESCAELETAKADNLAVWGGQPEPVIAADMDDFRSAWGL